MMDHGQFYLRGGLDDDDNEYPLLEHALAAQPYAGNGSTMVVLNPHQNNFEMPIDVELFDSRPTSDDGEWQQMCEDRIAIGPEGVLQIDSTTMSPVDCAIPPGEYLVQVAGRGFVNYGWPGDTTPGDQWRIRLWPDDGSDPREAVRWNMPGFGVPENAELLSNPVPYDAEQPSMAERAELEQRATQRRLADWGGGEPIEKVAQYNGGQPLTKFDRQLVLAILAASEGTARDIAIRCATMSCEHAGLAELPWVRPALEALAQNCTLPAPFDDISHISDAFAQLSTGKPARSVSVTVTRTSAARTAGSPFGTNNEPRYMTMPAMYTAQDPDAHRAAIETVWHASHAFGARAPALHSALREEFPELDVAGPGRR
ncbi:MAG: hypothetical protein V7694_02875 [Rhodococcus sp. (in: high G+C Gram-positive bacteria)]